jgi:hypothetical protein
MDVVSSWNEWDPLQDRAGFATALTILSVTYIAGIVLVSFMRDERAREVTAS